MERVLQPCFASRCLPWDLLISLAWVLCCLLHVHQVHEVVLFGCGHGPGWCHGSFFSRVAASGDQAQSGPRGCGRSSPEQPLQCSAIPKLPHAGVAALPGQQGQGEDSNDQPCSQSSSSYPCSASLLTKLRFIRQHWPDLLAVASQRQAMKQLLPSMLLVTASVACHVLVCMASSMAVLSHLLHISRRSGATAAPHAADAGASSSSSSSSSSCMPAPSKAEPAWLPRVRLLSFALLNATALALLVLLSIQRQLPREYLRLSVCYTLSSAARGHCGVVLALLWILTPALSTHLFLLPQLGTCHQLPAMLLCWSLLTAGGCALDRWLLGSALAGWPSYLWALLLVVGLTPATAAWQGMWTRSRIKAGWAQQRGSSAEPPQAVESTAAQASSTSPDAPGVESSSSSVKTPAAATAAPAATATAPAAAAAATAAAAGCAKHGEDDMSSVAVVASSTEQGSASRAAAAAAATAATAVAAAATARLCRPPSSSASQSLRCLLDSTSRAMQNRQQPVPVGSGPTPCPEVLYSSKAAGQRVTISVKVKAEHGDEFQAAAQAHLQRASAALTHAARSRRLVSQVLGGHAFPGCIHMLLEVVLLPAPGEPAEEDPLQAPAAPEAGEAEDLLAGLDMGLAAALEAEQLMQQQQQQVQVAAAGMPLLPLPNTAVDWQQLPWAALLNPLCLASRQPLADTTASSAAEPAAAAAAGHCLRVGLPPGCAQQLPAHPQVVVTGYTVVDSAVQGFCQVLEQQQVWAPASSEGHQHISISGLPESPGASVMMLHLLPESAQDGLEEGAEGGGPAGQVAAGAAEAGAAAPAHPLCSLPLLQLPQPAAEEVLQMFGAMVGELIMRTAGAASADVATAARQAYWQHYVPFVCSWRNLLVEGQANVEGPTEDALQDISSLLSFLAERGMRACLDVAAGLVAHTGLAEALLAELGSSVQQVQGQVPDGQQCMAVRESAGSEAAAVAEATDLQCGFSPGQHPESQPFQATACSSRAAGQEEAVPQLGIRARGKAAGKALHEAPLHARAGCSSSSAAAGPLLPSWRSVLLGFPAPSLEASYLAFKNIRCMQSIDSMAAIVSPSVVVAWLVAMAMGTASAGAPDEHISWLGLLLYNLPWAVLLLARGWYQRHREAVLLLLGGASRVVFAWGHGVLSLQSGTDMCVSVPNCMSLMVLGAVLHFPLLHQMRLLPGALLALVDCTGAACYVAFKTASVMSGVACCVASYCVSLLIMAVLERRCRAVFLAQPAHSQ